MKNLIRRVAKAALAVLVVAAALAALSGQAQVHKGTRGYWVNGRIVNEPPQTGFCRYWVDCESYCVGDITEAECVGLLGGSFSQVPCDLTGKSSQAKRLTANRLK
jgi:hypothetical protein